MKKQHISCKKTQQKQHKPCKKSREYVTGDPIYRDFLNDTFKKDIVWCSSCQRFLPPSYYDKKGKPVYIHSCYDASALKDAEKDAKRPAVQSPFPKNWGKLRPVRPIKRAVKPYKTDGCIRTWNRWIQDEIRVRRKPCKKDK
jgi:hypothetical protein